jgi:hypothetical protein
MDMAKETNVSKPPAKKPVVNNFAVCGYERCSEVAETSAEGALPMGWIRAFMDGSAVLFSSRDCLDKLVAYRRRLVREHRG